ncbi:hypothetical protein B6D60_03250 [candidate division KSB1 bacterium 4484_87]|nr:MAG: hypothetical protein B6D60_03250 [candidate division KSB1 bacterium 4484_87]
MGFGTEKQKSGNSLSCLILAAGFGSRLKNIGVKPLLPCREKAFLQIVVENALQADLFPIVSITNQSNQAAIKKLNLPTEILLNEKPEQGMFSSIRIGVQYLHKISSGILIAPVDYPLVKSATYQALAREFKDNPNSIIIPSLEKKSGHPVIIPEWLFSEILQKKPASTLREIVSENRKRIRYAEVSDAGILLNINSEAAYWKNCQ